jgi:hypothetical protein
MTVDARMRACARACVCACVQTHRASVCLVCVCVRDAHVTHTHAHTHTHARAHTHTHTHDTSMSSRLSHCGFTVAACVHARACTCMHVLPSMRVLACTRVRVFVCLRVCVGVWRTRPRASPMTNGPFFAVGISLVNTDACTHIGAGGGRDRFWTIKKRRRCDCAGCRAQSARVLESDDAPGQAVCRLARFGELALHLAPVACTHECNSHRSTLVRSSQSEIRLFDGLFAWTVWEAYS